MKAILAVALAIFAASALAVPEGIPIQYSDPHGRQPSPAARWSALRQADGEPYSRIVVHETLDSPLAPGKVILIVEDRIYSGIQSSLSTFQSDLEGEGYTVEVWTVSGGSASDIRSDLQTEYGSGSLDGAICIGDIPTGWQDNGYGEYPVDLYLMDMNGTWNDPDGDGLFESCSGEAPEIWVGRLTPTFLTFGSSVTLLNNYFDKNHAYRTGVLSLPDRALAYEEAFTGLTGYLSQVYSDITLVDDPVGTNADDFKEELLYGYEWVHLISHSSPWGSSFHTGAPPEGGGTLNFFEVPPLEPNAFFYVLNCCSNGRWTEIDNLANTYIWCDEYGLAALAQSKVDYTNDFQEYYGALGSGANLGDAFKTWLGQNLYYEDGAVLLGDPTLKPHGQSMGVAGFGDHGGRQGTDLWLSSPLTDGFHTQGRPDTYTDPSSGNVFATCGTSDPVRANILATYSDGDSWAAPMIVCEHEYWDWHPTVGGDGEGNVWVAWQSMRNNLETYDIFTSHWNGSSWESAQQPTSGDPFEVEPTMDGGGGHAWLIWQKWEETDTNIEGMLWTGSTWTSIETISSAATAERHPEVAYGGGRFGLVYQALKNDDWVICFRDAPDSGPFGSETVVSASSGENRYPSISSDGDYFWVVWQNESGQIMCATETGSGWNSPEVISGTDVGCRPSIAAASPNQVSACWTTGNQNLRVAELESAGWGSPYTALSEDALDDASLAFGSDNTLWALYGRRGLDLQWDLWAAYPDPAGVSDPDGGEIALDLQVCSANPFRASVALQIAVPGTAALEIFDISGRQVHSASVEQGQYTWNALGSGGAPIPSGVYFARLRSDESSVTLRLVKI